MEVDEASHSLTLVDVLDVEGVAGADQVWRRLLSSALWICRGVIHTVDSTTVR